MENNFTGVKELPSGFWAAFASGQYIDASSLTMKEAKKKLEEFLKKEFSNKKGY